MELSIVLAVIGIVGAGIWISIGMVHKKQQINQAANDIQQLAQNVRSLNALQLQLQTLGRGAPQISALVTAKAIPSDMTVWPTGTTNAGLLETAVGGQTYTDVIPVIGSGAVKDVFRISTYNIDTNTCIQIAAAVTANAGPGGPVGLITQSGLSSTCISSADDFIPCGSMTTAAPSLATIQSVCTTPGGVTPSVEFDYTWYN